MPKSEHIAVAEECDVGAIARSQDVMPQTVLRFLQAGVKPVDVEDVVDLRNKLTSYNFDKTSRKKDRGAIIGQATVEAMIDAYNACEGDVDDLGAVVEHAEEILDVKTSGRRNRQINSGDFNNALRQAVFAYLHGGIDD